MLGLHVLVVAGIAGVGLAGWGACAAPLVTLYQFSGEADGAGPGALLAHGGQIYGTTHSRGGTGCYGNGCGTIFSINTSTGEETSLYTFQGPPGDGAYVFAGLMMRDHVLYGTASAGGPNNLGTVYKFDPATGVTTVLHGFGGAPSDGASPQAALIYQDGALYGTTTLGGAGCGQSGCGTVFRLNIKTGVETVLYSFRGGSDGAFPSGAVTYVAGALYGTTQGGDVPSDFGTVYKVGLTTIQQQETVLHRFAGGADGAYPLATLTYQDSALYGTTQGGDAPSDFGTVFRVDGLSAQPRESVLHSFAGGRDGALPEAPVVFAKGKLYGTTVLGGGRCAEQSGCGTVYRLDQQSFEETIVHRFKGDVDGAYPESGITRAGAELYGTTFAGGMGCNGVGCGTVFRLAQ